MIRSLTLACTLLAGMALPFQAAGAAVQLGRISQVVNALHGGSSFAPGSFGFSIVQGGSQQTLFTGIEGARNFSDFATLNDWAAGFGSSPSGGYNFTHGALGSYFGNGSSGAGNVFGGYKFTHSALGSYFQSTPAPQSLSARTFLVAGPQFAPQIASAPVPEPASWALMIGGFALAGTALRRRRRAPLPA